MFIFEFNLFWKFIVIPLCYPSLLKMYGPPVDLSYYDISKISDAMSKVPRTGLRPLKKNLEKKYLSCSVRLSYNSLTNISGLDLVITHLLAEPLNLGWLDLSFNKITGIDSVLCELKELRVLYLHGNSIYNLNEVDKLGQLSHLHTITLHGNALENTKDYRYHVISTLPHLKTMDFSSVTRGERALVNMRFNYSKPNTSGEKDTKPNE